VAELHDTVAVAVGGTVTLLGDTAPQVSPAGTVSVIETVPENPPEAATVMVDVAEVPTVTVVGEEAVMVKSLTAKIAVEEWDSVPLVPVMVSV